VIGLLMALAIQQATTPADLPALVTARIRDCVAVQIALDAHPEIQLPDALWEAEALDGSQAEFPDPSGDHAIYRARDGEAMARSWRWPCRPAWKVFQPLASPGGEN
jgi:hypothetical protein